MERKWIVWAALNGAPVITVLEAASAEEAWTRMRRNIPGDYEIEVHGLDDAGLRWLGEGVLNNLDAWGCSAVTINIYEVVL